MKTIFNKTYCDESLYDLFEDLDLTYNQNYKDLPGMKRYPEFKRGTFIVTVTWHDEGELDGTN